MQSVILPFTTEVLKLQDVTVEWKHEDKKVHVRQNGRNQSHDQEVNQEPLTNGNLQHTDDGTYTCTVYSEGEEILLQKVVSITVRVYPVEMVNATQGEKSILLPFKVTDHLPQDVKVEWRLINPEDRMVYVYERSKNESPSRDHVYRGRAEMTEDPLTTKDLSLTLKDLRLTDSGVYTCTVYNKDGHMLLQKVVTLSVRDYPLEMVEVTQGEASVLLPFKITEDLLQDIKVEWKHQNIIVHVYQNSQNQSLLMDEDYKGRTEMNEEPLKNKDLSLTLKGLQLSDRGGYTCTVYNKDGSILLQKVVTLSVRGYQTEMVEVMEGEGSVLIPFKITGDLPYDIKAEWRLTHPEEKMVHVYESGNNLSDEDDQEQVYSSRTEMNEDPVTTKDLSLILKDLHLTDSGVYTCTVYNKYGYKLLQKSVTLSVRDVGMQMVVTQGLKFVMLPFKIPRDLPQGTTVEWRHNSVKVYKCKLIVISCCTEHQPRRDRAEMDGYPLTTGDFSLTLRDPHLTDSGVYTCIVNNTYRDILLQKVVTLSVRDNEVGVLEVTQGERSVLLPFQTTADLRQGVTVEWTRSDSKHTKVCVFQKSQSQADKQHQGYRGRAEMDEDPLRTGDFSLTLKDLRLTDSGVYTCTIYNKDGHMLLQRVVTLSVRATLKGAMADMLARLRRRRAAKSEIKVEKRNTNQEQERLTAEETV
ncbi:muscle M-line assembly protein unc-89-like [Oreochromis aureus]|uniref:muscle M-line assembly protein unc-89-like n=1 Tax=Oreochromis aureus TaxID=47969 RepID=UPI001953B19D|nr:muscle M-line assembly protein unc-89-like [Oreochromis aureus]